MNISELTAQYGLYFTSYIVCFISGFVPVVNAELYLVWAIAISPPEAALGLIVCVTTGQMTAKVLMYLSGAGLIRIPLGRYENKLEQIQQKLSRRSIQTSLFIFASAAVGIPPFYLVSISAGILKHSFARFFIFGLLGRLVRFLVIGLFPALIKGGH